MLTVNGRHMFYPPQLSTGDTYGLLLIFLSLSFYVS
jgi:hypothetical protein